MPQIFIIAVGLLPVSIYIWMRFLRFYQKHNALTKRWPSLSELKLVLNTPGVSSRHWIRIYRFRVLLISYYVLVAFAVLGYIVLFFV